MKRIIAMLIAVLLMLGMFPLSAVAQSTVAQVQQKVDALPDLSTIEEVESDAYTQAFLEAADAVYSLACLTEVDMERVSHYEKAFQLYIDLMVMKIKALLPKEPTTLENYDLHTANLETINQLLYGEEQLFLLAEYTYETVNENFYPSNTTTGFVSLYDVQVEYHAACDVRTRFLSSVSDVTRFELQLKDYGAQLAKYPSEFNEENVMIYAKDFLMLIYEVEEWDGKYYWLNEFSTENQNRYDALRDSYEVTMGIFCDYFIDQMDLTIEELCISRNTLAFSPLRLQLLERPVYDYMAGQIEALAYINGNGVYNKLDNLSEFEAFQQQFWTSAYIYGDANGDCLVDASDALMILKVAVGKEQLSRARFDANDLNMDGSVDAKDALYVLQYAVEKIYWFPVEMQLYGILV